MRESPIESWFAGFSAAVSDRRFTGVFALGLYPFLIAAAHPSVGQSWANWVAHGAWALGLRLLEQTRMTYVVIGVVGLITHLFSLSFILDCRWSESDRAAFLIVWLALSGTSACALLAQSFCFLKLIQRHRWPFCVAIPVSVVGSELLMQMAAKLIGTSSDVLSTAISQVQFPWIIQSADLGGPLAVAWFCGTLAGLPLDLWDQWMSKPILSQCNWALIAAAIEVVGLTAHGAQQCRYHRPESIRVAIVPIPVTSLTDEIQEHIRSSGATVALFPEEALKVDLSGEVGEEAPIHLRTAASKMQTALIAGVRRTSLEDARLQVRNSAIAVSEAGTIVAFRDKVHLTPLFEVTPELLRQIGLGLQTTDQVPYVGGQLEKPFEMNGVRFSTAICHDVCFSSWSRHATGSNVPADLLIQLANEGVSRSTSASRVLLACAQIRAVEARRTLLRCVHHGYSAAVDGNGRALWHAEPTNWNLPRIVNVPLDDRISPFARWGYFPIAIWIGLWCVGTHFSCRRRVLDTSILVSPFQEAN